MKIIPDSPKLDLDAVGLGELEIFGKWRRPGTSRRIQEHARYREKERDSDEPTRFGFSVWLAAGRSPESRHEQPPRRLRYRQFSGSADECRRLKGTSIRHALGSSAGLTAHFYQNTPSATEAHVILILPPLDYQCQ